MIPIRIHPLFLLMALFLAFMMSQGDLFLTIIIAVIIAFSILVHEFGHALAGLAFHQRVTISLLPFGGLTERQGKRLRGWQDFLIVLMGPLFGFSLYLAASFLWVHYPQGILGNVFAITAIINLYWTLLNLVPVLPLDGGQLVRVILQGIWGVKGLKAACILSIGLGGLAALGGLIMGEMLLGSIFAIFAFESWRIYNDVQYLKDEDTDVHFQRLLAKGEKAHERGEAEKSREIYTELRRQLSGGALFNLASLRLAEMALAHGNGEEAYTLLEPIKNELSLDGLALFHEAAFLTHHWQDALFAGTKVAKTLPTAALALKNAQAAAELGDKTAEEGWMKSYHKSL